MSDSEYGVFTEEGCIEASLWSHANAEAVAELYREQAAEDDVEETYTVHEMCEEHRDAERPKGECDECEAQYND
ncbi:hypothetical protein ACFQ61_08040 [Streptomyces sp. NPDC056500]|uniref:hypothetical protein n=1 Tax=Streptomyces sp. NPDC056500 TaxID=3345840 RepID=UPI00369E1EEA